LKYLDTKPLVLIQVCAYLNNGLRRVEWGWVVHVLSKFNFGEKLREWVQMLFKYAQTCIKTNGFGSVYSITSCIRRLASLILRPFANPFWSECINFGKATFNLSARIFAIILLSLVSCSVYLPAPYFYVIE
jgi:phosphomevalonate kinase